MFDSDLSLGFLRVVERAAIACAHTMGQGHGMTSDRAAVEAMRKELDSVPMRPHRIRFIDSIHVKQQPDVRIRF